MTKVPDAWEDDWINSTAASILSNSATGIPLTPSQAHKPGKAALSAPILSKSERRTQHQEANKKLWDTAENSDKFHFLDTRRDVPLKSDFKPQLTVLSRKPTPASGSGLAVDDDSEEERRKQASATLAERQRKAALEREEKQRKYAEARERIMGSSRPAAAQTVECSTGGAARTTGNSRQSSRRGRMTTAGRSSHSASPAEGSPAPTTSNLGGGPGNRTTGQQRQLFDPDSTTKPQEIRQIARPISARDEQPIRMPRGPDSSGRAGFASRGGRGG